MSAFSRPPSYTERDLPPYKESADEPYTSSSDPKKPPSAKSRQAWGEEKGGGGGKEGEKDPGAPGAPGGQAGAPSWKEFTQNTTMHGVKYVFDGSSSMRR